MILGLPAVAPCGTHHPAGWWHCRGSCRRSLQKVPRPLPASSPTLAILLGQIRHHPCQGVTKTPYLCTHPWHPTKWPVNSQRSPPLYTWCKKKMVQPDFCQFAGWQGYLFSHSPPQVSLQGPCSVRRAMGSALLQDVPCHILRSSDLSLVVNRSSFILRHLSSLSLLITWQLLHPLAFNYPAI